VFKIKLVILLSSLYWTINNELYTINMQNGTRIFWLFAKIIFFCFFFGKTNRRQNILSKPKYFQKKKWPQFMDLLFGFKWLKQYLGDWKKKILEIKTKGSNFNATFLFNRTCPSFFSSIDETFQLMLSPLILLTVK